jgi:hypothetical protein
MDNIQSSANYINQPSPQTYECYESYDCPNNPFSEPSLPKNTLHPFSGTPNLCSPDLKDKV